MTQSLGNRNGQSGDQKRRETMKYSQIIIKAWRNLSSYRALWVLGFLLALTTFSGSWIYMDDRGNEFEFRSKGIQVQVRDNETFWQAFERSIETEFDRADQDRSCNATNNLSQRTSSWNYEHEKCLYVWK